MTGPPSAQLGPPPPEAAKTETWLKGHLAHLTQEEDKAFAAFKELCIKHNLYKQSSETTKASHDDGTLMRYLRARRFVPEDALTQFKDTEHWRKDNDLEALYEKIDIKDYSEARSVYPQWTGRRDKRGMPVYLYEVHKLDTKKMSAYASSTTKSRGKTAAPSKMLRLFALYENLTRFVMPLCTAVPGRPNAETPIDQSNNIVDISKVGLKQFWNLRGHMQDASQLATAHYPETLDRIFILGAPSFFPTVWGWIKRWFDPITTSKMFILSHEDILPTLTQFIDIEDIPKKYGGELDFECGDMPNLDPALRDCISINPGLDNERYFLTAPVRWLDAGDDGEMTALGVGTVDGKQRHEEIAILHSLATRVATQTERLSRAPTKNSQMASATPSMEGPARGTIGADLLHPAMAAGISANLPVQPAANTSEPPVAALAHANINEEPHHPVQNGNAIAPQATHPEKLTLPSRPTDLTRTTTEFVTPPTSPSELKTME